jgi:1-hydroxycarotenoid 3,4-desaturase
MYRLVEALSRLIERQGGEIRCGAEVAEISICDGRARGVRLATGDVLRADAVLCNADAAAVASGCFGTEARRAADAAPHARRSLSAITWAMLARCGDMPLKHHNVFFSADYRAEFDDIFTRNRVPRAPTVYVCAQDRAGDHAPPGFGPERLFCVVNAPPAGDACRFDQKEVQQCFASMIATMARCGLRIETAPEMTVATTPSDFHAAYPATGGAIYGQAQHGWMAAFQRAPARSRIAGLYFAGGSVHPGAGLPMAALSGRLAAAALRADWVSQGRFHPAAMRGGMSMA